MYLSNQWLPSADWRHRMPHGRRIPPKRVAIDFSGTGLNEQQQPTFNYEGPGFTVTDFIAPVAVDESEGTFRRTLAIRSEDEDGNLHFRAAVGSSIEPLADGWFLIDNTLRMRVEASGVPILRDAAGRTELIVPITEPECTITQELVW